MKLDLEHPTGMFILVGGLFTVIGLACCASVVYSYLYIF